MDRPSISLTRGVHHCTEYEVKVISAIGDVYSEDSVRLFTTSPIPRAAESLNISLASVGKRSAVLTWRPASDLPCVSLYNVSLCREQPHRGCVKHYRSAEDLIQIIK